MNYFEQVYNILKTVPNGKVTTYGDIARALGNPHKSQIVGYALHVNPDPEHIPCYKVLNRFGALSDSFAFGGKEVQKLMLNNDGIEVVDYKVDLEKYGYRF